jgi:hypothetical protein
VKERKKKIVLPHFKGKQRSPWKRNRTTVNVKEDCQQKQRARDELPPDEKKILEQDENG